MRKTSTVNDYVVLTLPGGFSAPNVQPDLHNNPERKALFSSFLMRKLKHGEFSKFVMEDPGFEPSVIWLQNDLNRSPFCL